MVGEAAGLAMGLVMIGTRSPNAIHDMIEVILIIAPLYTCTLINYTTCTCTLYVCIFCEDYIFVQAKKENDA